MPSESTLELIKMIITGVTFIFSIIAIFFTYAANLREKSAEKRASLQSEMDRSAMLDEADNSILLIITLPRMVDIPGATNFDMGEAIKMKDFFSEVVQLTAKAKSTIRETYPDLSSVINKINMDARYLQTFSGWDILINRQPEIVKNLYTKSAWLSSIAALYSGFDRLTKGWIEKKERHEIPFRMRLSQAGDFRRIFEEYFSESEKVLGSLEENLYDTKNY